MTKGLAHRMIEVIKRDRNVLHAEWTDEGYKVTLKDGTSIIGKNPIDASMLLAGRSRPEMAMV